MDPCLKNSVEKRRIEKAQKMPQGTEEYLMCDLVAVLKSVQDPFIKKDPFIKNIRFKK